MKRGHELNLYVIVILPHLGSEKIETEKKEIKIQTFVPHNFTQRQFLNQIRKRLNISRDLTVQERNLLHTVKFHKVSKNYISYIAKKKTHIEDKDFQKFELDPFHVIGTVCESGEVIFVEMKMVENNSIPNNGEINLWLDEGEEAEKEEENKKEREENGGNAEKGGWKLW